MRKQVLKDLFKTEGWEALVELLEAWKAEEVRRLRYLVGQHNPEATVSEGEVRGLERVMALPGYVRSEEVLKAQEAEARQTTDETPIPDDGY